MKKVRIRPAPRYPDDCRRIVAVAAEAGYSLSLVDAETIWTSYSNSVAAGWMILPNDDERILHIIESHSEVDHQES